MTPEIQSIQIKWLEALESDKHQQHHGSLSNAIRPKGGSRTLPEDPSFCCLGVFCEITSWEYASQGLGGCALNVRGLKALGMSLDNQQSAMILNDTKKCSFPEIATYFRKLWNL